MQLIVANIEQYMSKLLNNYLIFSAIVECGSLTAAAKRLAVPKSKLSRQLAELEVKLDCQLLIRTTRRQHLTDAGLLLYQSIKPHIEALSDVEELITSANVEPKGKLNILLPLEFFNQIIGSLITDFAAQYPDISINCQHYSGQYPEFDHQYDLVFVLHEGSLPASNWVGRTLLSFPQGIYVSNEQGCRVTAFSDLAKELAIVATNEELWHFRVGGNTRIISPDITMVLSSPEMRLSAAQRGIGLVKLPHYIAENNSGLSALSLSHQVVAQQLTLLYQSRNIPAKTRIFLDYFQSNIGLLS